MKIKSCLSITGVLLFIFNLFNCFATIAQNRNALIGAWHLPNKSDQEVVIFQDSYFTHTVYNIPTKKFILSRGGTFQLKDKQLVVSIEFNSGNPEEVGQQISYDYSLSGSLVMDISGKQEKWERSGAGASPLAGVWQISDRMQEGKIVPIHRTGTRKTIKVLSGNRFQWVAIDPQAKQFSGTGGGTYTFENGKYVETIEFFSRDSSRVGAKLGFDGRLENEKWHHSGLSSKGDKIYEIWSRVK